MSASGAEGRADIFGACSELGSVLEHRHEQDPASVFGAYSLVAPDSVPHAELDRWLPLGFLEPAMLNGVFLTAPWNQGALDGVLGPAPLLLPYS